ncbi:thiocyanate hydrolase subunit gamma [Legionella sp. D16C41]|uniref:thiocyanate hydrolase subunit gamma n=1 Tax=Legionella sp. D16C41 TaxID=3402688 RepID=UPI003AF5DF19
MAHDHLHTPIEEHDEAIEFTILETAIRELAIEKGLFSREDHRRFTEWYDKLGYSAGSRVVARAWVDPEFKQRLLTDGVAACKEMGIDWLKPTGEGTPSDYTHLIVCENTPKLHNTMVCTLCSCYPRPLLGIAPAWYERPNYRRRMVRWPRQVLAEFGTIIPPDVEVRVHDSNQRTRFMILPLRPEGTEDWSEDKLASIVTRDTMIGVSIPRIDWTVDSTPGA